MAAALVNVFQENKWLLLGAIIWASLFFVFYPGYFASTDEHAYAQNAFLLSETGSVVTSKNELYCGTIAVGENQFTKPYPVGKSLLLAPVVSSFGLSSGFMLGFLAHLVNFVLIALILRQKNIPREWALIYLVFPAFQWSARTLYPELHVLTAFLAAYYILAHPPKWAAPAAGFILGVSTLFRFDAILGIFAFSLFLLVENRSLRNSRLLPFLAGAIVPILVLISFNTSVYNRWLPGDFSTPANIFGRTTFSDPLPILTEIITFLILLTIVLPFSLWVAHKHRDRVLFLSLIFATVVFFSRFYSFWALETSLAHIFTVRLRYFIPLLGLLLIPTLAFYNTQWQKFSSNSAIKRWTPIFFASIFLCGTAGSFILNAEHQEFIGAREQITTAIQKYIPNGASVIGKPDMCTYFITTSSRENPFIQIDRVPSSPETLDRPIYLIDATLESQLGFSGRQHVIDRDNNLVSTFIKTHEGELTVVYSQTEKNYISIWEWRPNE